MSQKTVQLLIGQLLTDEELRLRFVRQPLETLTALRDRGFELTNGEIEALVHTDRKLWDATAKRIHSRLQRCNITGREL
jgi:spore germination protein YaaH